MDLPVRLAATYLLRQSRHRVGRGSIKSVNHETHQPHERIPFLCGWCVSWFRYCIPLERCGTLVYKRGATVELIYKEECYWIMGACFEVYREMGCGFLEPVYQECTEFELSDRKIPFAAQYSLKIHYKQHCLKHTYTPDFISYGKIILELKAVSNLTDEHRAQVHNYLKATGLRLGLLVNFGHYPGIEWERIVR